MRRRFRRLPKSASNGADVPVSDPDGSNSGETRPTFRDRHRREEADASFAVVPDLVLNSCIFGVLIGGRLGYCLFYQPALLGFDSQFPYWGVLRVWDGGMSAHGGVLFTVLTLIWFSWRYKVSLINIGDAACMVVPIERAASSDELVSMVRSSLGREGSLTSRTLIRSGLPSPRSSQS